MTHWYPDVVVKNQNRIAVVVCAYAGELGYHHQDDPEHAQKYFADLQVSLKAHEIFKKSTLSYDLIVVDNGSTYQPVKGWLRNNWVNQSDRLYFERENKGFSFGAFEYVWQKFGETYDFYLFLEQDFIPAKEHWLEELIAEFYSEAGIGAVGGSVETANTGEKFLLPRARLYNLSGMYLLTSSKVLKECGMKVYQGEGTSTGVLNEINFTQPMLEQGYKLKGINSDDRTYTFFSDGSGNNIVEPINETIMPLITLHVKDRQDDTSLKLQAYLKEKGVL